MKKVAVQLRSRSYAIHIGNGIANRVGRIAKDLVPSREVVVVSSKEILRLHGEKVLGSLSRASFKVSTIALPQGERYKSLATLANIYRRFASHRVNRRTTIIAFGGGVIGDIAGFAAASYLRGLPLIQLPTTLLAQIDSSIGGKTGVNLPVGKNLVGAFHQPRCVIVDPLLLASLPVREFRSGIYEALKYGVIKDRSLFMLVDRKHHSLPGKDKRSLEQIISRCAEIKAQIVAADETETGVRMILNYGHTIGHALEAATEYRRLTHGEAIGHGMLMANQLAVELQLLTQAEAELINAAIVRVSALPRLNGLSNAKVFRCMLSDKKFESQRFRFVLPRRIGDVAVVTDIPPSAVAAVIRRYLNA